MKNMTLIASLGLAIVAGGLVTTAEASGGTHRPHHSFEELDANSDGKLTQSEIETHMQTRFQSADTNGDGNLSKEELLAQAEKRRADRAEKYVGHMLERHDANGDGALSFDELQSRRDGKLFARMDANQDGSVSKDEFDAARERMKDRRHKTTKDATE